MVKRAVYDSYTYRAVGGWLVFGGTRVASNGAGAF